MIFIYVRIKFNIIINVESVWFIEYFCLKLNVILSDGFKGDVCWIIEINLLLKYCKIRLILKLIDNSKLIVIKI